MFDHVGILHIKYMVQKFGKNLKNLRLGLKNEQKNNKIYFIEYWFCLKIPRFFLIFLFLFYRFLP